MTRNWNKSVYDLFQTTQIVFYHQVQSTQPAINHYMVGIVNLRPENSYLLANSSEPLDFKPKCLDCFWKLGQERSNDAEILRAKTISRAFSIEFFCPKKWKNVIFKKIGGQNFIRKLTSNLKPLKSILSEKNEPQVALDCQSLRSILREIIFPSFLYYQFLWNEVCNSTPQI